MDDLTVAKWCAKALEYEAMEAHGALWIYREELRNHIEFKPLTDPAIAFRLVGWLAERGEVRIRSDGILFIEHPSGHVFSKDYTTPADRIAAVAKLVARVMEGQG